MPTNFNDTQKAALLQGAVRDTLKDELAIIYTKLDDTGEAFETLTDFYNALRAAAVLKVRFDSRVQKATEEMIPVLEPQIRESANVRVPGNAAVGGLASDRTRLVEMKTAEGIKKATDSIVEQLEGKFADQAEKAGRELAEAAAKARDFLNASQVAICSPASLLIGGKRGLVDLQKIAMTKDATMIMGPDELRKLFVSYDTLRQTQAAEDLMLAVEPRGVQRISEIRGSVNGSVNGKNPNLDAAISASEEFNQWVALLNDFAAFRKSQCPQWMYAAAEVFDLLQSAYESLAGSSATFARRASSDLFPTSYQQPGYVPFTIKDAKASGYRWT